MIKLVGDLRQTCNFLRVLRFPPPIKLTTTIYWNIVESDVKHHQTNKQASNINITPLWYYLYRSFNEDTMEKLIFSEVGKSMKMALVALTKNFGWVSIIVTICHSDGDNMDQTYQHIFVIVIKINILLLPDRNYWY